jgi:hypothetical protein
MPNESGLTPLGNFAHQNFLVGNPPAFLFTEDGKRVDRDLVALSMQLRQVQATERLTRALENLTQTANVLEGNEGTLMTTATILLDEADEYRDAVQRVVRTFYPATDVLAITSWSILGETSSLEVGLNYTNGEALILLGRFWQEFTAQRVQEGGQRA